MRVQGKAESRVFDSDCTRHSLAVCRICLSSVMFWHEQFFLKYSLFSGHVYSLIFDTERPSGVVDNLGIGILFNGATVIASYVSADSGFGGVAYRLGGEITITFESTNGNVPARDTLDQDQGWPAGVGLYWNAPQTSDAMAF